ncbi:hypothetical protein GCM10029964_075680 [Kibdelosporangium lantanae]
MTQPPDDPEPLMPFNQDAAPPPPGQSPYPQYPDPAGGAAYPVGPGGPVYPPPPPQGYARPVRPLGGLAMALTVLLGLASVASVASAFPHFSRANVVETYKNRAKTTLTDANAADQQVLLFTWIFIAVCLATVVLWMIWQFRFASNGEALGPRTSMGAPGWAIGGWFIPLANLLLPSFNMSAACRASGFRPPALLPLWAVAFGVAWLGAGGANSLGNNALSDRFSGSANSVLDRVAQADRIFGGALILLAVAGVLGILLVRTLSTLQESAAAARQQQQQQPYPPQYPQY